MRKKLFPKTGLLVWLLSSLWFSVCLAGDVQQTQNGIVALIKSGQIESAQSGIDKLIADFPQSPDLPQALCWFAEEYGYAGKCEDEQNLYQRIIQQFPDNPFAAKAKLGLASAEARTFIVSQDYKQAKDAIDKLIADFNGHPDLPNVLYRFARGYEWSDKYYEWANKYEEAKNIFQYIVDKYPDSGKFDKARLGVYRMNICSLIVSKQFETAQDKFDKMMTDFAQYPDLPDTLEIIGRRYESSDRYAEANDLYLQVITNWPDSSYAQKAKFGVQRVKIRSLIVSQDANDANLAADTLAEADAAIDKLIADFVGNPDLPDAIYWIAQRYGYSGNFEEEKNLYQYIMQNYSNTLYADRAKIDLAGGEVLSLVVSEDNNDVNAVLEEFVADLNSHPYLPKALLFIVDKYYEKATKPKTEREMSGRLYHFTIDIMEKYVFDRVSDRDNKAEAYYRAAVSAYRLGDSDKTIEYSEILLQADPNFRFAANMEWLVADGYERLKASGKIPAADADIIIEETYQDLMDKYPQTKVSDYASSHLGMINYRQGNKIKACAYLCWYLMNASPDAMQDEMRMAMIKSMTEGCGRNSNGK